MIALQYPSWKYDRSVSPEIWNTSITDLLKVLEFLFESLEETNFDVMSKDPTDNKGRFRARPISAFVYIFALS
jgi:hypothetical protein